jgi:hypothetical protein
VRGRERNESGIERLDQRRNAALDFEIVRNHAAIEN